MRKHMISWKKGGIPMAVIDSAYQYYLSTYAGSGMSRYDTHKKSQLRAVYNNIVKVNKDSPLYKINFTRDTGRFAIDIKEQARSTRILSQRFQTMLRTTMRNTLFPGR